MQKRHHIDQIKYALKKHDYANHPAIIEAVLNDVYNQILYDTPVKDMTGFEFYTKTYEVTVSKDSASDRYYSTLPAAIVTLRNPNDAIVSINSKKGTGFRFFPTTENEQQIYDGLEANLVYLRYGYYVQNNKVWYTNYDNELASAGVRMALAVEFREFASTDEVPLPAGRSYDIKQLALDYIRQNNLIDIQIPK